MTRHIGMNAHRDAKMEKHQYLLVPLASIWTMGRLMRVVILDVVVDMERRISKYEYYDHEYGTFYRSSYEIDCTCRKITNEREENECDQIARVSDTNLHQVLSSRLSALTNAVIPL